MDKAKFFKYFHLVMTGVWALLVIPTVIWWKDSILWVALMSVWANLAAHFSAYQGARTEKKEDEKNDDS